MRVFLLAALVELVVASNVILHHRVFDPLFPDEPWRQWAVIPEAELPAAQSALATTRFSDNLDAFIGIHQDTEQIQNLFYQVALQTDDLKTPLTYDFSSVRLCHLAKANSQTLLFHLSKAGQPQSVDFFVSPIPQDGSCPTLKADAILESFKVVNTTILTRHMSPPPQPELFAPPQLSQDGEVVTPPPEKSFLQKYWIYITAALVVLLFSGTEEAPQGAPAARS